MLSLLRVAVTMISPLWLSAAAVSACGGAPCAEAVSASSSTASAVPPDRRYAVRLSIVGDSPEMAAAGILVARPCKTRLWVGGGMPLT